LWLWAMYPCHFNSSNAITPFPCPFLVKQHP